VPAPVQVAWLTGTQDANTEFVNHLKRLHPNLPLIAIAEFPVEQARWIPFHPRRALSENFQAIAASLRGEQVQTASMILMPQVPYGRLRLIAVALHRSRLAVYDRHFKKRMLPVQLLRVAKAWLTWHAQATSPVRRWAGRIRSPRKALVPLYAHAAYIAARFRRRGFHASHTIPPAPLLPGTSVIIPSRNGRALLQASLPPLMEQHPSQVLVVDNGSSDGSAEWLRSAYPQVETVQSEQPLSFARAINRGLKQVKHTRVLLLNNDMQVAPEFLPALEHALDSSPALFCATAQILFPDGQRREETGKAVLRTSALPTEFPVRCELPLEGEDGTWVLYGSGGCSLFDTRKLQSLGGLNELLAPAYVEDLDLGFRAWQQEWPTVFCAHALVEHRHRATTARYYTAQQLDVMVQVNYLRFLVSAIVDAPLFRQLWNQAIRRLHLAGAEAALKAAVLMPVQIRPRESKTAVERNILALTNGDVAVFPGKAMTLRPIILIATPYLPFPLSHGGAVRIFNLMREAAREFDLILVAFTERWEPPAPELLSLAQQIVLVRRPGSHYRVSSKLPDTVEEFSSETFRAALRQAIATWHPAIVQLEWTQMAQYAADCLPAATILVEHDITMDLFEQLASQNGSDPEIHIQLDRWRAFETSAWHSVSRVVTMSEKDRATVGTRAIAIPNGVDTERFQPSPEPADQNRLLFIGSFAHHPNRSAMQWFIKEVWPHLKSANAALHIIAGKDPEQWAGPFQLPGITLEGFVSDVRPAYRQATVVIAPLIASAGTNIKILEAMAMGKAIVSTSAGVNGLNVEGVLIADTPRDFANAILALFQDATERLRCGQAARQCVEQHYSWATIGKIQSALYREL
jgi:GT2 family glycosyltransferase/glycosyltransferase involved in cell wall biosynthesis